MGVEIELATFTQ